MKREHAYEKLAAESFYLDSPQGNLKFPEWGNSIWLQKNHVGAADKEHFSQRNLNLVLSWQPVADVAVSLSLVLLQINYRCSSHVPLTVVTEAVVFGPMNIQLFIIHE